MEQFQQDWSRGPGLRCCSQDHRGWTTRGLDWGAAGPLVCCGSPAAPGTGSAAPPPAPGRWRDWDGNWSATNLGTGKTERKVQVSKWQKVPTTGHPRLRRSYLHFLSESEKQIEEEKHNKILGSHAPPFRTWIWNFFSKKKISWWHWQLLICGEFLV